MRRNPFEELESLLESFTGQFEDGRGLGQGITSTGSIAIDVIEHDEEFVVSADLPGFDSEDIDLTIADGVLRLSAEREIDEFDADERTDQRYIRRERTRKSINRRIRIPDAIDEDGITASHRNGLLTVTLPKSADADEAKRIDID